MQLQKPTQKEVDKMAKAISSYKKANDLLLKKYKITSRVVISFPGKKKTPKLGKLAMWTLNKIGAILDTEFKIN